LLKNSVCKLLKKILEARRAKIDERRRTYSVRWSKAIERNEAYESFSAACAVIYSSNEDEENLNV
jgi:hypothetical protein